MKTLVNKRNSQVKITAPDGMVKNRTNCWTIWSEGNRLMLLDKENWTLVEEEPKKEQSFTHHEIDESLQNAVTHQMEDDGDIDDFVRKGIDNIALKYAVLGAKWQKEQKPVDLEKVADDYVMQTASGTAEEMETLIDAFKAGAEWQRKQPITFNCIGKQVTMTVQQLIDYYIDSECVDVADECGF